MAWVDARECEIRLQSDGQEDSQSHQPSAIAIAIADTKTEGHCSHCRFLPNHFNLYIYSRLQAHMDPVIVIILK